MQLLPVIIIGSLLGLFIILATTFLMYRLWYVRKQQGQYQATVADHEQPTPKFMIRRGRIVEYSRMSQTLSIISPHLSARNSISDYSTLSLGIRNGHRPPCGSSRYWPVSVYSMHSRGYTAQSQRQSTFSGHHFPLPSPGIEAQHWGLWEDNKEILPFVEEVSRRSTIMPNIKAHASPREDSLSTNVNDTALANSSRSIFGGTSTPPYKVEVVLDVVAETRSTFQLTLPGSRGESLSPVTFPSVQNTRKHLRMHPTSGIDGMLSEGTAVVPTARNTTYPCSPTTRAPDNCNIRSTMSNHDADSSDYFGFGPLLSTAMASSSPNLSASKHSLSRKPLASLLTFNSDVSSIYAVGHATSVILSLDPRTSPMIRPPPLKKPLSKYRLPVEDRYRKPLPILPSSQPVLTKPGVCDARNHISSTMDDVSFKWEGGSRTPSVLRKKSVPGTGRVKRTDGEPSGDSRP